MTKPNSERFSTLKTPDELIHLLSGEVEQFISSGNFTVLWEKTEKIIAATTDLAQLDFFKKTFIDKYPSSWPLLNEHIVAIRRVLFLQLIATAPSTSKLSEIEFGVGFLGDVDVIKAWDTKYAELTPKEEEKEEEQ